jgi:N-acetylglucosaminyl-diphospho-decaprenol L-rhamnosyltransferase
MTPDVSAVVVTYRSSGEARECIASLRMALATEGISGEIVLVDCGSGGAEARRLASAGADVLVALPDNRGYSGGVNAGLARARSFRLLASNADVLFRAGSIGPL